MRIPALILLAALFHPAALAKSMTWDAGLGLATLSFPAYRGASDRRQLTLPLPSFSIESRDFQLGRNGAELALNHSSSLALRLSGSGSLPVDSDNLAIRDGMPNLLSSVEIGPALRWKLWSNEHWRVYPELLVRGVIATDLRRATFIGWVGQPQLSLKWQRELSFEHSTEWRFDAGPVFADNRYHGYYYDVAPEFATPGRPAHSAAGGYSGWRLKSALIVLRGRLGLYAYAAYDNLERADFRDSPLVQDRDYWLGGVMLSWRLFGPHTVEFD